MVFTKKFCKVLAKTLAVCAFIYSFQIVYSLPSDLLMYEGEGHTINMINPVVLKGGESVLIKKASPISNKVDIIPKKSGKHKISLSLLGVIPFKTLEVNVKKADTLIPGGNAIGIKLHSDGLIVVGTSEVVDINKNPKNPAKDAGVKEGDVIVEANGQKLSSSKDFANIIKNAPEGIVELKILRNDTPINITVNGALCENNEYKLGIWVRDGTAGVGTLTFYNPKTREYGALGHPISDVDTGIIYKTLDGKITRCIVKDVKKGRSGWPGELVGSFAAEKEIGDIRKNTTMGIFGYLFDKDILKLTKEYPVALKWQVKEGKASILATLEGEEVLEYDAEIISISKLFYNNNKNMIIKITDERLLKKSGGIVQGMSGSPILQDGKIVGAVTHVFVNDPTKGYGAFIENMLNLLENQN